MPPPPSFTDLLERLRARDPAAAEEVFRRYSRRLFALAQARLDALTRRRVGAEDVVQSVFKSFFRRQEQGHWQLDDWGGLWGLLAAITARKCSGKKREARAACRDVQREVAAACGDDPAAASPEPGPEEAAALVELVEGLLAGAEAAQRDIVALTLQGEPPERIGELVGCSTRKVYRVQQALREHLERLRDAGG